MSPYCNTKFLLIGTKQQLEKVNFSSITVGDTPMEAKSEVRNLQGHCLTLLTCLSTLGSFLSRLSIINIPQVVFVSFQSRCYNNPRALIDYCNNLLHGVSLLYLLTKCNAFKCHCKAGISRATPLSRHTPLARAALATGQTAGSLQDFAFYFQGPSVGNRQFTCKSSFFTKPGAYRLRSSHTEWSTGTASRRTRTTDRSFQVAAPKLWNALSHEIRSISDVNIFKHDLNTHLFSNALLNFIYFPFLITCYIFYFILYIIIKRPR